MKENLRTILRCTGVALVVIAALVLIPAVASAQHTTGLAVSKDCPIVPIAQGECTTCTFTIRNLDPEHGVMDLTVTNTFPYPGGTVTDGVCLRDDVAVTTLGLAGDPDNSCSGSFEECAPISCSDVEVQLFDQVQAAGIDAGVANLPVTGSTTNRIFVSPLVCTNGSECTTPLCVEGEGCVVNPVEDSTACTDTDGNACNNAGCEAGVCVQAHTTDTCPDDNNACTGDGVCDPADGSCDYAPLVPLPDECQPGDEICRTPGFWGTHGGTEKDNSTNITQALLDAYNAANDPDLTICGRVINNTDAGNVNSALEAICVSPKGDSRLQLVRQLTAAALNCIITNTGDGDSCIALVGDVCGGVSVEDIFEGCNEACVLGNVSFDYDHDADPSTEPVSVSCISAIDCFNNGGVFDPSDGSCDEAIVESCHDRDLDNGCFDFQPPGAAGSPRECNEARKNDITVPPPPLVNECVKEAACGAAAVCGTAETCEGACFFTAAGNTRCFTGEFGCDELLACVTDVDCPANWACSNTCCGLQCAPLCGTPFPTGAPAGGLSSSIQ